MIQASAKARYARPRPFVSGRPISLFMTAGQVRDHIGVAALLDSLPEPMAAGRSRPRRRLVPRCFAAKGITPCIPGRKSRTEPIRHDKRRYKRRHRI